MGLGLLFLQIGLTRRRIKNICEKGPKKKEFFCYYRIDR